MSAHTILFEFLPLRFPNLNRTCLIDNFLNPFSKNKKFTPLLFLREVYAKQSGFSFFISSTVLSSSIVRVLPSSIFSSMRWNSVSLPSIIILVSKKFALLKKPVNPSRFRTHPAVPELSALCIILAVFLKGGKNVSADSA